MTKTATSMMALLLALGLAGQQLAAQETTEDGVTEDGATEDGSGGDARTETDAETGADMGTETGTDTAGVEASGDFMSRTGMSLSDLVTEMGGAGSDMSQAMTDLTNLSTETEVIVVRLSELEGAATEAGGSLDEIMAQQQGSLLDLHGAIGANMSVRTAIEAEGMMTEDVVAVHRIDETRMVVVVDDQT
jgi:hypothetical protein